LELIAKGYTDIEIDYRAAKRDWLEASDIAKSLGEDGYLPQIARMKKNKNTGWDGLAKRS
jgi:hypothetical protein